MNSFLLSLTVLLIVALSALFAVPYLVDFNDYRDVFEAQATKVMGRDVAVEGPVELRLLPVPGLRFEQVTVAGAPDAPDRPFVQAKSLQATLNVGALLKGKVEAQELTIVDPVLRLNVGADGTGDWGDIGRHEAPLPFAPKQVAFDSVSVSGGRIAFYKQGEQIGTVEDIDGKATAASLSGPYKVSASYRFDGAPQEIHFSTGRADANGDFRLKARLREVESGTTLLLDGAVGDLRSAPHYRGSLTARVLPYRAKPPASVDGIPVATLQEGEAPAPEPDRNSAMSLIELKGDLSAQPDEVSLSPFELTIHSRGRSQMMQGKFAVSFGSEEKAVGEVKARWVDVDALLAEPDKQTQPDPAARMQALANVALQQAGRFDAAALDVHVDQVSLGGDLVTDIDMRLTSKDDKLTVESLKANMPGETAIAASGVLTAQDAKPVFDGKLDIAGKKLATLTRWAAGDRGLGQTSAGDFSLKGDAQLSETSVVLSDIDGEVSGTNFSGGLRYEGGKKRVLDLDLESQRLDLREVLKDGGLWSLSDRSDEQTTETKDAQAVSGPLAALTAFDDATVHIGLNVDELLLPDMPSGSLEARLDYADDRLAINALEFTSPGTLDVTGDGELRHLNDHPQGRLALHVSGDRSESLKALADTLGLSDSFGGDVIAGLAPIDLDLNLQADREGEASQMSLSARGQVAGADLDLRATALGDLDALEKASLNVSGKLDGITSAMLLASFFPELSEEEIASRLGRNADARNMVDIAAKGVPEDELDLSLKLAGPLALTFAGEGAYRNETLTLQGQLRGRTDDAAMVLALAGVSVPPSARGVPVDLRGKLTKKTNEIHLYPLNGEIAGESVELGAHILLKDAEPAVYLDASMEQVSLPVLFGPLIAWDRTASTEEMLGTLTQGKADVWPARGFALGPLSWGKTQLHVKAKTMFLGSAFPLKDAQFKAQSNDGKLDITVLKGKLFDGLFTASGQLAPRGEGAHLDMRAELAAAKMSQTSRSLLGKVQAKSEYGFSIHLVGDGLSPPGLVAGLSGKGRLSLRPGEIHGLNADAYAKALKEAVKTDQNRVNETQVVGLADRLAEEMTDGIYHFDATILAFDVQNGTVRLKEGRLANSQALTKVKALVALPSLRLDSEWTMTLKNPPVKDAPPVSLVLAGPLERIGEIEPRIDTDAFVGHFTVRRMQQDVERLENLDVTGQRPPEPPAPPPTKPQTSIAPEEEAVPEAQTVPQAEAAPEIELAPEQEREAESAPSERRPQTIEELLKMDQTLPPDPEPDLPPALAEGASDETGAIVDPERRPEPPPAQRRRAKPQSEPGDWKKGIPLFGYGGR